ncbi:transporter substrate-binding domain-containing protein [Metabacillus sediminilitoris]|uniref:histidine kinase n=1 Tax=Metabacillus sediminilitoris TaxID=2567941 RepID=A0A4S4BX43_9BACI|nr:transporter substrate-binding domain-containing protein [Metabacillus sediminilitoris]QGQ45469.1 transporter substrate-binding domain-containing protein [Metabacillus sediminilitoris]THF77674.1 transporter substrate-binding domain-containing protein [Metabacillus sediminilitoris]
MSLSQRLVIAEDKTYKIAGEWALPPFSYKDQRGSLTGINIDLMKKIADENGLTFEYIPMEIHEAEQALRDGEVDAIAGITYSTEKDKVFDFTQPYFTMSDSLIIPMESRDKIKSIEDIREMHIVLQDNTPVLSTLLNLRNTNLTLVTNHYTGLLMLLNDRSEIFIGNKFTSSFFLKEFGQEENYLILDEVMNPVDYAIAVKEGDEDLLLIINQTLTKLKATGEVSKLIDEWVSPENEAKIARLEHFIFLLFIFLLIGALILIVIYIWNQRLKEAVNIHTKDLQLLNEDLQKQRQRTADSHAFKDQILNNIDTGIVTFDIDFKITSCNKRALEILELPADTKYNLQHSPIFLKLFEHYRFGQVLQQENAEYYRFLEINDNGERKVIYYSLNKMFNSLENQAGYLLSMNDETEKKKLEQKLITQEKLHALGQLVAGVAHEIRNPLTSIKTFIDLIPKKYDQPKFQKVLMEHLPEEVNRLNRIVTDLIDYARPSLPNIQHCTALELTSLLAILQVNMDKNRIEFKQYIEPDLVFNIDPQQIRQVLFNLLLNAIHAVEESEVKEIKIIMEKEDFEKGRIMIRDTGKGMEQGELNHIFEPFFTTKGKGVGLGLSLSYNLIKENNGDIQVNSIPNKETTFTVVLPLYQKEEIRNEAKSTGY